MEFNTMENFHRIVSDIRIHVWKNFHGIFPWYSLEFHKTHVFTRILSDIGTWNSIEKYLWY